MSFHARCEFCKLQPRLIRISETFLAYFDAFQTVVVSQIRMSNQMSAYFEHPIINSYFRYGSSTRILYKKPDRVLE